MAMGVALGTEFLSMLAPPNDALKDYDNTKRHDQQTGPIPQIFRDAMSVREEVYGEQGVRLEAEFDEDDARSFHWVVYASVAQNSSSPPPQTLESTAKDSKADEERRASATAQRLPVGTLRLVPPPHGPNKYKPDKHPDADPPPRISAQHPTEAYVKLGRLAVLAPYRSLGLSKLLISTALDYAAKNPDSIRPPPPPTKMEAASKDQEKAIIWEGLTMVHAQASVTSLWEKQGFSEELVSDQGEVEIAKEEHWTEENLEHLAMWRRLKLDTGRL